MNLDQTIVNWAFGIAGVLGGVIAREMWAAIKDLRGDLKELSEKIGREYVKRDDFKEDIAEIKAMLARLFDKLDTKADK